MSDLFYFCFLFLFLLKNQQVLYTKLQNKAFFALKNKNTLLKVYSGDCGGAHFNPSTEEAEAS